MNTTLNAWASFEEPDGDPTEPTGAVVLLCSARGSHRLMAHISSRMARPKPTFRTLHPVFMFMNMFIVSTSDRSVLEILEQIR